MSTARNPELPSSALPAAGRVDFLRLLAWLLLLATVAVVVAMVVTPWQQSVRGAGRVIAYAPLERQQSIEAPIDGRVVHWHVQEGDQVARGQPIAELADNDPEILSRLAQERDAARAQVEAVDVSIALMEAGVVSLQAARDSAVTGAGQQVQMATDRVQAAQGSSDAASATLRTAELQLERQRRLHAKGLSSLRELELAELDVETARTSRDRAEATLNAARSEVGAARAKQKVVDSSSMASIQSTGASLEKLRAERAKAEAEVAKVGVRLARQDQMQVVAPRAGVILRLLAHQGTEMVKAGEPLVTLVPDAGARAVEMFVDGNDAPLVDSGRPVRLQFEGWPALQFVGWPSAAVGTFEGKVDFVDAHDDGSGRFRVVIVPEHPEAWPDGRYLRQGVRANGWVLLNRVRLGFELWRQFNGFPPALAAEAPAKGKG